VTGRNWRRGVRAWILVLVNEYATIAEPLGHSAEASPAAASPLPPPLDPDQQLAHLISSLTRVLACPRRCKCKTHRIEHQAQIRGPNAVTGKMLRGFVLGGCSNCFFELRRDVREPRYSVARFLKTMYPSTAGCPERLDLGTFQRPLQRCARSCH
jgi:hypothetical protein